MRPFAIYSVMWRVVQCAALLDGVMSSFAGGVLYVVRRYACCFAFGSLDAFIVSHTGMHTL